MAISWKEWNPGLDNDALTMQEVYNTLPGANPEEISMLVRLLENPKSPVALSGAVALERHDCIHILLGRGLLNQDEAFVIGYTMGTSGDISRMEEFIFKTAASKLYPKQYRFNKRHLKIYGIALELGKQNKNRIFDFPFEDHMETTLGELRSKLAIDIAVLRAAYRTEKAMFPHTKSSKRLPI